MNAMYLFALANFALCTVIGFIAICRLNAMESAVLIRVRLEYAAYFTAATVCGFQPLIGEWPGWASIAMSCALLIGLLSSAHAWSRDRPPASASGHDDFDDSPHQHHE